MAFNNPKLQKQKQTFGKEADLKRAYTWSAERRRFVRFPCAWKIKFCELNSSNSEFHHGKCRNLSQGGMKLNGFQPLKRKAIVLIEIDPNLFSIHINLSQILKISAGRILGHVAWRHLNLETGLFEAGIEFLQENQRNFYPTEIEKALSIK